jgi:ascorbate-specific PTS system EIIC-type component UlaA
LRSRRRALGEDSTEGLDEAAQRAKQSAVPETSKTAGDNELGDMINFVKTYAKQETVGPLRNVGRWLASGIAGALALGIGLFMLVLGVLRLLQTEASDTFDGNWSVVPYVVAAILCVAAIALALWRVGKGTLEGKERR